jgi:hypothetical protein
MEIMPLPGKQACGHISVCAFNILGIITPLQRLPKLLVDFCWRRQARNA